MESDHLEIFKSSIQSFPNFPKEGVNFKDVFATFRSPKALKSLLELVKDKARSVQGQVDLIVGLDARGFLFGPIMAAELEIPFVPIRKSGKLPGDCFRKDYSLEYGSASVEIQKAAIQPGQRVLLVDDLLATGGTLAAAVDLVRQCDAEVFECFVLMELAFLAGRKKIDEKIRISSLVFYDAE